MLVYGDPQFTAPLSRVLAGFRVRIRNARRIKLQDLRTLMIQAGQIEQAIHDTVAVESDKHLLLAQSARITDIAAKGFYCAWCHESGRAAPPGFDKNSTFTQIEKEVARLEMADELMITIKVPEGFEFYALYPEQYCLSALQWAADHEIAAPKQALVLGIRSIGTTLSAVVSATLQAVGWKVDRMTVRPTGSPFSRTVPLQLDLVGHYRFGLVVDEGPGISGSSMVAGAQALSEAGIDNITFFPGHQGNPGAESTVAVRRWWNKTPRYVHAFEDIHTLPAKASDLGGGLWRNWAFEKKTEWPAVMSQMERRKFLQETGDGNRVLWKFSGLGSL